MQVDPRYPEKPGNLVLGSGSDDARFARLAEVGSAHGSHIWSQLGHAGALADTAISRPAGPSALDIEGLRCDAMSQSDVESSPAVYARGAAHVQAVGFSGSIEARCQVLLEIVRQVRAEVGRQFGIAVKVNSSDQLEGGLSEEDALISISLLGVEAVDLIDISGGTYFPGAPASSDRRSSGPYFLDVARQARTVTDVPLMLTGGFKTRQEAANAVATGAADVVGLARTMALDPDIPAQWTGPNGGDPTFPSFDSPPAAWFTMRLTALANGTEHSFDPPLSAAIEAYEARDAERVATWKEAFETGERPG